MSEQRFVENGRKGGLAKGKKYWKKIKYVITLFIRFPDMTQAEIAKKANVSQAFVSKHTSYTNLKIMRLHAQENEDELEVLLEKIKFDIELGEGNSNKKRTKI